MLNTETAISTVKNFINECSLRNIHFQKVILFGSVVRNLQHNDSDIDIALVSDSFTYDKFENAKLIAPVKIKYLDIDAHTYPPDYFSEGDPFIEEIIGSGIEIK